MKCVMYAASVRLETPGIPEAQGWTRAATRHRDAQRHQTEDDFDAGQSLGVGRGFLHVTLQAGKDLSERRIGNCTWFSETFFDRHRSAVQYFYDSCAHLKVSWSPLLYPRLLRKTVACCVSLQKSTLTHAIKLSHFQADTPG